KAPLLANMTEYGKSPLMSAKELEAIGYKIVIFPLTAFRASLRTIEEVYRNLYAEKSQRNMLGRIMTRERFYETIGYDEYEKEDNEISRKSD
ncbi:methylisocitrate lyase, partial [Candidatus Marsarchaeota archaeon]|nr:methylisocitrate lyase [Candidatus Marsarchaeota archaeon]